MQRSASLLAVVIYLAEHCGMSFKDIDKLMNKQSGLVGMTGTADFRSVMSAAALGQPQAELAVKVCHP
jgi:acetate kinase